MEHSKLSPRQIALERCRGNMVPIPRANNLTARERKAIGYLRVERQVERCELAKAFGVAPATVDSAAMKYQLARKENV